MTRKDLDSEIATSGWRERLEQPLARGMAAVALVGAGMFGAAITEQVDHLSHHKFEMPSDLIMDSVGLAAGLTALKASGKALREERRIGTLRAEQAELRAIATRPNRDQ